MSWPRNEGERKWGERLEPVINSLPDLFKERYLRWPKDNNFIDSKNPAHIQLLKDHFKLKPFQRVFYFESNPDKFYREESELHHNMFFEEVEVDGLYRTMCVDDQIHLLYGISLWLPTCWQGLHPEKAKELDEKF